MVGLLLKQMSEVKSNFLSCFPKLGQIFTQSSFSSSGFREASMINQLINDRIFGEGFFFENGS